MTTATAGTGDGILDRGGPTDKDENDCQYAGAMLRSTAFLACATFLLFAGCGESDRADDGTPPASVDVVVTTTHLADLVRSVGGNRAEVTALLGSSVDPHDYEVRPSDMQALFGADLVARSGGDLDEWLTEAIDASGSKARKVNLIDHVRTIDGGGHHHEEDEGKTHGEEAHAEGEDEVDPHWWQDPRNGVRAVTALRDALVAIDPEGKSVYTRNASAYAERLRALDAAIEGCFNRVPVRQRKLVTTHDSLGYYADRYDIEVIGTVIPSLSTQGQPSAGEIQELVETIEHENVEAIFTEATVSPKVERAIAAEAEVTIGEPLWTDSLGPQDSAASTYVEALASNTRSLVEGMTGSSVECRLET